MTIREQIKKDFGVDLPISGGRGNSIDDPIIIDKSAGKDCSSVEYAYLRYVGLGRNISWKINEQALLISNGRKIDQIKIETEVITEREVIAQVENYYFDITECL